MSSDNSGKKIWEELLMGAIERIAQAPSKLKDPKESVTAAMDWVKSMRDDLQGRIAADVSQRLSQIDWESLSKKVGEHLADRYDVEVTARIKLRPKKTDSKQDPKIEDEVQSSNHEEERQE